MLPESDVNALVGARHPDAGSVLGMQRDDDGRLWLRAMLPHAVRVDVCDAKSGKLIVPLVLRHKDGFFEGRIPRKQPFDYRLRIRWDNGEEAVRADAYAHVPSITDADLRAFSAGTHVRPFEIFGAHPLALSDAGGAVAGVRFAVWAPNARHVSVVGDFNFWDGRRHPMCSRGESGVWELFVPHAAVGDRYKFEVRSGSGDVPQLKADPFARAAQYRPETASIVSGMPPSTPLPVKRTGANSRSAPISIYEVHLGSWRRHADGGFFNWHELAATLPQYAADLGFTHVELLPVTEHPFDGSWGYQALGLYAATARFGPPAGLTTFVESCHAIGVGVLLDWVPAHFPSDAHGPVQFDGTALYEYADPREGFHRDWNTLIYNFGRHEVRSFLTGSALYWLDRYGVDGLRVDAVASMLYRDYSRPVGEWVPNVHGGRENLEAISLLKHVNETLGRECSGAVTVAEESTAFPGVSAPTYAGGLGFHYKWNMGWMHDTLQYMKEDPVHRCWHHDRMTFGLGYAFSENFVLALSHDEVVHGKGTLLGRMPGDDWQRFANLRAYYGFMWAHPGKKLLFMGQEFAQPEEWNHDTELPWQLLGDARHSGMQSLIRDLNKLYREHPALHDLDCEASGFEWIDAHDAAQSVFSWLRRGKSGELVLVVCNFTPVLRHDYRLGVPDGPVAWREILNTDLPRYGGSGVGNGNEAIALESAIAHGRARSIRITLPPLATIFLAPD